MSVDLSELRTQVEILKWCKMRRAELKELEDKAKAAVQDVLGDQDIGTVDGAVAVTWKTHKRTALDQKYLKEHHPDAYEESQSTTEVRRFEVCD